MNSVSTYSHPGSLKERSTVVPKFGMSFHRLMGAVGRQDGKVLLDTPAADLFERIVRGNKFQLVFGTPLDAASRPVRLTTQYQYPNGTPHLRHAHDLTVYTDTELARLRLESTIPERPDASPEEEAFAFDMSEAAVLQTIARMKRDPESGLFLVEPSTMEPKALVDGGHQTNAIELFATGKKAEDIAEEMAHQTTTAPDSKSKTCNRKSDVAFLSATFTGINDADKSSLK